MSALPKPQYQEFTNSPRPQPTPDKSSRIAKSSESKPTKLSPKKRSSAALQLVKIAQVGSSVFATSIMLGSIGVYLATVRIPQLWSQEYETLEGLQRQERQLVAIDEALKYDLAQQARKSNLAMSSISSENTLFLPQEKVEPVFQNLEQENQTLWESIPLGY